MKGFPRALAVASLALLAVVSLPDPANARGEELCPTGCGKCRKSFAECPCDKGKVHDFAKQQCVPNLCKPPDKCETAAKKEIDRLKREADAMQKKIDADWDAAQKAYGNCRRKADVELKVCLAIYKTKDDQCRADQLVKVKSYCDQFENGQKQCQSDPPKSQWNNYGSVKKWWYTPREDCEAALAKTYSLGASASRADCENSFATSTARNAGIVGSALYRAKGSDCDASRDAQCPAGCEAELHNMNMFQHQHMQSDRDLKGLKDRYFECLPDGKCPSIAVAKKPFTDFNENLCGKKNRDAQFSCVGTACVFVGCK